MFKRIIASILVSALFLACIPDAFAQDVTSENKNRVYEEYTLPILDPITAHDIGYKVINAVTETTGDYKTSVTVKVTMIEDIYSLEDVYKESLITYSEATNNFSTGIMKSKEVVENLNSPQLQRNVLQLNENNKFEDTAKTDNKTIDALINKALKQVSIPKEYKESQGLTLEQVEETKALIQELLEEKQHEKLTFQEELNNVQPFSTTISAGAFDNYYRHNLSTGDFTVQALISGNAYAKRVGTTQGKAKNSTTVSSFIKLINDYEKAIVTDMESNTFLEVASWWTLIASGALLLAGFATGPGGWIAIFAAKPLAEMVIFLGSLTIQTYSTVKRTQASKTAAEKSKAAYELIWPTLTAFNDDVVGTVVNGY